MLKKSRAGAFVASGIMQLGTLVLLSFASSWRVQAEQWTCQATGIVWTYTVSDGKATLGSADGGNAVPLSTAGAIEIPSSLGGYPVTSVGDYAFYDCANLTRVTIPDSVTGIGDYAFLCCESLESMVIPDNVTSIGHDAFQGCVALTTVTIPGSVTNIGESAFWTCTGLSRITIPSSVMYIGGGAFAECENLQEVVFEGGMEGIEMDVVSVFEGTPWLASLPRPENDDFADALELTGTSGETNGSNFGATLEDEDYYGDHNVWWKWTAPVSGRVAFNTLGSDFEMFVGVCVGDALENLECIASSGDDAYLGETPGVATLDVDAGTTYYIAVGGESMGGIVLKWAYNEPLLTIRDGKLISVELNGAREVTIPDSVTCIGEGAFESCSGLQRITIPDSVTRIEVHAFDDSNDSIYDMDTIPGVMLVDGWVYAYSDRLDALELTGVRGIADWAFFDSELESVTIPNSVTSIGEGAFWGCSELAVVDIPDSVTSIGDEAFYGCIALADVNIPQSVTSIGADAFAFCGLTSVTIPASVTRIGNSAFGYCESLEEVVFAGGMEGIEMDAASAFCETPWYLASLPEPENDTLEDALPLGGASGKTTGSNVKAVCEEVTAGPVGEVWWKWTAPASGTVTFNTYGSDYDTSIAVFKGDVAGKLESVAENDDYFDDSTSLVEFEAASSTTYYIAVGGYETGNIVLNWSLDGAESVRVTVVVKDDKAKVESRENGYLVSALDANDPLKEGDISVTVDVEGENVDATAGYVIVISPDGLKATINLGKPEVASPQSGDGTLEKVEGDPTGLLVYRQEGGEKRTVLPVRSVKGLYYQAAWGDNLGQMASGEKVQAKGTTLYLDVVRQTGTSGFYKVSVSER